MIQAPNKRDLAVTGTATPLAIVLAWALQTYAAPVPMEVAAALGAVLTGALRWLTRRVDR